jgi:uncharacterized protein (TIGR02145 family)
MKKVIFSSFAVLIVVCISIVSCKKNDPDPAPVVVTPSNQFTDSRDNKTYKTVTIGTQTWMAENLNYQGTLTAGNVYCYNDEPDSCVEYGGLYDWDAANVACPNGYRLPSDSDWQILESYLGMSDSDTNAIGFRGTDQGTQLKVGGTSGFNAIAVGFLLNASYTQFSEGSVYWTSTPSSSTSTYIRGLGVAGANYSSTEAAQIDRTDLAKTNGFCVRCLKKN